MFFCITYFLLKDIQTICIMLINYLCWMKNYDVLRPSQQFFNLPGIKCHALEDTMHQANLKQSSDPSIASLTLLHLATVLPKTIINFLLSLYSDDKRYLITTQRITTICTSYLANILNFSY